ncbi:hypothetical protein BXY66_3855 [Shimia isoporae]|uniref:Uncharacterized protein n=1 Tax=Shimia isoporae TaxID=647720 RepID=A0A4R1N4Z5_9RHOB|nr:hypothetical protein [Shimia isoporae]TCK99353.1 hypothetical protein BXY66_3855 [Shimia isoporae]
MKDKQIGIPVTAEQKAEIEKAVDTTGCSLSSKGRELLIAWARSVNGEAA